MADAREEAAEEDASDEDGAALDAEEEPVGVVLVGSAEDVALVTSLVD